MRPTPLKIAVGSAICAAAIVATPASGQAARPLATQPAASSADVAAGGSAAPEPTEDVVSVVADALYALGEHTGFAGQKVDTTQRLITAHWKGNAPANIHRYAASRPHGVMIRLVEGARYSRSESLQAAQRLANSPVASDLGIQSVAVNSDGSGVTARVSAKRPRTPRSASRAAATARVAVDVHAVDPVVPTATRANDAPAWKGGARTIQNDSLCSTGFAVLIGTAGRLVSANHCDPGANAAVKDGAGSTIAPGGSSVAGISSIDSQLIDPSASPATTGRVYTGAWNSGTTAAVKGSASNWTGQKVCGSGATSGQHCGTITDDATTFPGRSGSFYIEVKAAAGQVMVAGGDSGGPVFATTTGGVKARGIILAGAGSVGCGAINPDAAGAPCYNTMLYAPISVVLKTWGVKLELG